MSSVTAATGYPQYSGNYLPEIWSSTMNVKFYSATVLMEICNTQWEGEITGMGDTVQIRQTPDVTVNDYQKGQDLNYESLEEPKIQLDIDKAKVFACKVDRIDEIQGDVDMLNDWAEDGNEQMKIQIDTDVLGAVYSDAATANSGNTAGAISSGYDMGSSSTPKTLTKNNIMDWLVDVNSVLGEYDVPNINRWIVLPEWACGMVEKSELKEASLSGDEVSILRSGYLGMIGQLSIYCSNLLNVSSSKYDVVFGHVSAITFASQYVDVEYLPRLERTFGSAIRGLNVFGWKTVKSQGLGHAVIQKG